MVAGSPVLTTTIFYEKTIHVILSHGGRRADRGRAMPRRFGAGGGKKRGKEDRSTFVEPGEESRGGGAEREGQIFHEGSGAGWDDGSRHGQDGPAKREERRREKDRQHDGSQSYQSE